MAAMVGSIWSRSALNMLRVSVELLPPAMNSARITSSKLVRNDSSAALTSEKRICGSVTVRKARARDAPRLRATISWFMSKLFSAEPTTSITSGSVSMLCASTMPASEFTSLIFT